MIKNEKVNKKDKRKELTLVCKSVSEIEKVIHSIGKKLVSAVYKKILLDTSHRGYNGEEINGVETITLEFLYDISKICMLVKINDFYIQHTYSAEFDQSTGKHCMFEDFEYELTPSDLTYK